MFENVFGKLDQATQTDPSERLLSDSKVDTKAQEKVGNTTTVGLLDIPGIFPVATPDISGPKIPIDKIWPVPIDPIWPPMRPPVVPHEFPVLSKVEPPVPADVEPLSPRLDPDERYFKRFKK